MGHARAGHRDGKSLTADHTNIFRALSPSQIRTTIVCAITFCILTANLTCWQRWPSIMDSPYPTSQTTSRFLSLFWTLILLNGLSGLLESRGSSKIQPESKCFMRRSVFCEPSEGYQTQSFAFSLSCDLEAMLSQTRSILSGKSVSVGF